jgi:hypothetical protein
MKKIIAAVVMSLVVITAMTAVLPAVSHGSPRAYAAQSTTTTPKCPGGKYSGGWLFGLKPWYAYLTLNDDCSVKLDLACTANNASCDNRFNALWLIALAVFEDLLIVAGMAAVGFVMYGGIRYITSQGEPDHIKSAQSTIINALLGLTIAFIGSLAVNFIGNQLGGLKASSGSNPLPNVPANGGTIRIILNIVFGIVGAVTVLFVTFGGFKYVTSRGEPQETAKAKDTIMYALIGMAVTILAATIVNFIIGHL